MRNTDCDNAQVSVTLKPWNSCKICLLVFLQEKSYQPFSNSDLVFDISSSVYYAGIIYDCYQILVFFIHWDGFCQLILRFSLQILLLSVSRVRGTVLDKNKIKVWKNRNSCNVFLLFLILVIGFTTGLLQLASQVHAIVKENQFDWKMKCLSRLFFADGNVLRL